MRIWTFIFLVWLLFANIPFHLAQETKTTKEFIVGRRLGLFVVMSWVLNNNRIGATLNEALLYQHTKQRNRSSEEDLKYPIVPFLD